MAIARYLAMTAEEFAAAQTIPDRKAWMACHFSPYSTSLSNLPDYLPENSLLILNDSTPPGNQDPESVAEVLKKTLHKFKCAALLLDFQRPGCPQSQIIAQELVKLDFPVSVSQYYAETLDCPIFLPPLPLTIPLAAYVAPWQGRQIWLDAALSCEQITVSYQGAEFCAATSTPDCTLVDKELHCHYHIAKAEDTFIFTLKRTKEDLEELLAEAEAFGVEATVGLYQELK